MVVESVILGYFFLYIGVQTPVLRRWKYNMKVKDLLFPSMDEKVNLIFDYLYFLPARLEMSG